MRHPLADSELQQAALDTAMIRIDRLNALAALLAIEEVASAFSGLSAPEQVAIFGTFEAGLREARDALLYTSLNKH
jgi:hypothetical protein